MSDTEKMTPTDKFVKLQESCAYCLQKHIDEIPIEDERGNLQLPDIPAFCKRHQKENDCECLALFKGFLSKKQSKDFAFCAECCASHDVEIAPAYMFQEVRGTKSERFCPLIPQIYDNAKERDEKCQFRLIKIMRGK